MTQHPIRLIGDTARCPKCGGIYYPDNNQTVCPCTANQPKETAMTAGLEHRYDVRKINDTTGKHDDCRYFVLDPQHDPLARKELETYRFEARMAGLDALSSDLRDWLNELDKAALP